MNIKQCPTCTIDYCGGIFYPQRGQPLKAIDWNTKCCQYVKKKGQQCVNACNDLSGASTLRW